MQAITVFCGHQPGKNSVYLDMATQLGKTFAQKNITLIYGGGNIGLMGRIADSCMQGGGKVIGVIPQSIVDKEVAHHQITKLHIVQSMHERKALMAHLCDAFIALPGGFGTLDELCEITTWAQLSYHKKPIGLLNTDGFYDLFIQFLNKANKEGFIRDEHLSLIRVENTLEKLLQSLAR